ncbi:MAG: helix-turn-helix domain-containing protein [Lachnospiraceae bacterium]|nr:helix-turn-helix domain-containing protein [Lachnospiraceae bacterium]
MKLYIKELREKKGITQKELAELMQVSFQTVSKWENGVNYPDITYIPKLADIFGVSSDIILGLKPLDKADVVKYDETAYWNEHRDMIKLWKNLYWNDDYLGFFIKDVMKFDAPVDMIDFGCGYGYLGMKFMPLLPEGSTYTGIELDKEQLKEADEYFAKNGYSYILLNENIYDHKPESKYDLVAALFLMSYMPRKEELLSKMKACLKPGGRILLMDVNEEVEQAGFYSGLEKKENALKRPDLSSMFEYDMNKEGKDYRMGTKLPYLLKKAGFKNISARISDQVVVYEPADENKKRLNEIFKYINEHDCAYQGGVQYYLNHGLNLQKAEEASEYYKQSVEYLNEEDPIAVKTSGIYFVYATL